MLSQSSVDHNAATSVLHGTEGGGVSEDGGLSDIHIVASTLSDNMSHGSGTGANAGGFSDSGGSTVTFANSTVSGNSATGANNSSGGGIAAQGGGTMLLNNTTVTQNTADTRGGGIWIQGSTVTVQNSIVADNLAPAASLDCFGSLATNGYNLIGTTTGCTVTPVATDIVGKSARLAALANNGGPTLTHALLSDSPAKDAGNPATPGSGGRACELTDQRGLPRPAFAACDVGAFELQPTTTTTTTLPGSCGGAAAATFESIDCRLDILITQVQAATDLANLKTTLLNSLTQARSRKMVAEGLVATKKKLAKKRLKEAMRKMVTFNFRVRSRTARRKIPGATRKSLGDQGGPIQKDMQTLLKTL